ncbi:hypothetical protein VD0002_g8616 [Verticillium dahliae]|uniref:Uncharacterized protein n=1 Tax=Verticillium dahliae TaxID=27337 RepID=A0AA45AGZ2_VERDA|nr:hypothetical protein EV126DRAFT_398164 [Verticillium dahliae]PNH26946.1 hypothetical protein BJF96_g9760 [Verticillium dahliae]PNH58924.1 hypothetical protein VD0002_g8616 [Verticillium dahliae]
MRRLVSIFLLTVSAVLLMVGLASKEMRTKGIVTVRLDVPRLDPRQPLDLPAIPKFSDLPDLPSLPDGVNSVATAIATRVSDAVSQPTGFLGSILDGIPGEITVGTDQVCYGGGSAAETCQKIPSEISEWLPSPLDVILDITPVAGTFSAVLKVKLYACLIATLVGVLVLVLTLGGLLLVDVGTLGIFSRIPILSTILVVGASLFALVPLVLASMVAFSVPMLLRKVNALEVDNGPFLGCLGAVLVLVVSAVVCCVFRRRS